MKPGERRDVAIQISRMIGQSRDPEVSGVSRAKKLCSGERDPGAHDLGGCVRGRASVCGISDRVVLLEQLRKLPAHELDPRELAILRVAKAFFDAIRGQDLELVLDGDRKSIPGARGASRAARAVRRERGAMNPFLTSGSESQKNAFAQARAPVGEGVGRVVLCQHIADTTERRSR